MDIFLKHQLRIARSNLKMSDAGARIMGGMTKAEARILLSRIKKNKKRKRTK